MSHLATALLHFQADPPPVHLDATNPHFGSKFASLGGVVAAVRPALNKHGLVVTQLPTVTEDGAPALETKLIHAESGEELAATMPLFAAKQDPQAQGSALTYARRYALLSILGLVGDADDDANAAQPRSRTHVPAKDPDPHGLNGSRADAAPQNGDARELVIHFGKNSGKKLGELTPKQIEWYAQTWEPNPEYANEADQWLKAGAVALHSGVAAQPVVGGGSDLDDIPFTASEF